MGRDLCHLHNKEKETTIEQSPSNTPPSYTENIIFTGSMQSNCPEQSDNLVWNSSVQRNLLTNLTSTLESKEVTSTIMTSQVTGLADLDNIVDLMQFQDELPIELIKNDDLQFWDSDSDPQEFFSSSTPQSPPCSATPDYDSMLPNWPEDLQAVTCDPYFTSKGVVNSHLISDNNKNITMTSSNSNGNLLLNSASAVDDGMSWLRPAIETSNLLYGFSDLIT